MNREGQCDVPLDLVLWSGGTQPSRKHEPSFCTASSSLDEPVVDVEHTEPPAHIAAEEAAEIVAEQHASWMLHNIDSMTTHVLPDDVEMEPLLLLQFSRSTEAFQNALSTSRVLEPVLAALSVAGHRPKLPSGAMILTDPAHFTAALVSVAGQVLQPCHVIVTESLEPLVHDVVDQLPRKQKIRLRRAEPVGYVEQSQNQGEELRVILVRRTFLEVPRGLVLAPTSVIQSTTEALERRAVNPRRWKPGR